MVEEDTGDPGQELPLEGVAQKLKRARIEQGMSLEQVAQKTRIAQRHLELIETGQFAALPARTYAFGFTRTYAQTLGMDGQKTVDELRQELANFQEERPRYTPGFEPGDPAKVPPRAIVWISAFAAVSFLIGVYLLYARDFAPGADPAPLLDEEPDAAGLVAQDASSAPSEVPSNLATPEGSPAAIAGQVVFTALEEGIWVSFYEAGGRRLEQKLMAEGERFVVPIDARDPRVWTGRPDAFAITIGGQAVAKLAEEEITVRDIPITAEALRARSAEPVAQEQEQPETAPSSARTAASQ